MPIILGTQGSAGRGVPWTPKIGTATAGNARATITFTAPSYLGSPAGTAYTVRAYTSNGTVYSGQSITGTALSLVCLGLTNGVSYTFRVELANTVGVSSQSELSNAVVPFVPFSFSPFGFTPVFSFTPTVFGFSPYSCVHGDTLIKTTTGYSKAKDLYVGQKLVSYDFEELPQLEKTYDMETWSTKTLSTGKIVEATIQAIKIRQVSVNVMFNGLKTRRFSLEHMLLARRDDTYMFVQAGVIRTGDYLVYDINDKTVDVLVEQIGYLNENTDVYDFTVSPYDLFIAGDIIAHNKKGAFQGPTLLDFNRIK
jgi:hypothetical protein